MRSALRAVVALALMAAGCGDDDAPADTGAVDGGVDAADSGPLVELPEPPALPMLAPCPEGWAEVEPEDGSPTRCDPFPAAPTGECPLGQALFVGESGCAEIGPPCPADGWPIDLPTGSPVLYVRADAAPGGDGSVSSPFAAIRDAIMAAPSGATIAVAAGEYEGDFAIDSKDLHLVGACLSTVIEGVSRFPVITLRQTTSSVENVRLVGGNQGLSISDAVVDLRAIETMPTTDPHIASLSLLRGSMVTAESVLLRGPINDGLAVSASTLDATRFTVQDSFQLAVSLSSSTMTARDFAIRRFGHEEAAGTGLFTASETTVELERVAIVEGFGEPVLSSDTTNLSITDGVIVGPPLDRPAPLSGIGSIGPDGVLSLERVFVAGLRGGGIVAAVGTVFTARDLVVLDTLTPEGGSSGYGLEIAAGTDATLERVYLARSTVLGLLAEGSGTVVEASDITILDVAPNAIGTFGRAVQIQNGANVTLRRAELRDSLEAGMVVAIGGSSLDATDVAILSTDRRACAEDGGTCPAAGVGLGVYERGAATVERFLVRDSYLAGAQIARDGALDLADGIVESNPVGANVQVSGYDLGRLMSGVVYRDNGVNLDAEELPVPDPEAVRR